MSSQKCSVFVSFYQEKEKACLAKTEFIVSSITKSNYHAISSRNYYRYSCRHPHLHFMVRNVCLDNQGTKSFQNHTKRFICPNQNFSCQPRFVQWFFGGGFNLVALHFRSSLEILCGHILSNLCNYRWNLWCSNSK